MIKGKDLGIKTIVTVSKEGTPQLKELHCLVNDVMYLYGWKYISPKMAMGVFDCLSNLGKKIKDLPVSEKAAAKKGEILTALRDVIRKLKQYINRYQWVESDAAEVQKSINFLLADYLKHRSDADFDAIKAMTINKQIWDDMYMECPYKDGIKVKPFKDMQEELLKSVADRYALVPAGK